MIMSTESSIGELFNANNYIFYVPNYQRYFVWGKNEIQSFLDDALYTYKQRDEGYNYQHFFGQIILRKKEDLTSNRKKMEIVDGQQRLSTISILAAVIYEKINILKQSCNPEMETIISGKLYEIETSFLSSRPQNSCALPKLYLSKNDNAVITAITQRKFGELEEIKQTASAESVKNLCFAYDTIKKYIEEIVPQESTVAEAFLICSSFIDYVSRKFRVVLITTESAGYDYALYQIVNDRGISLTSAELLKARTMQLLSSNTILSSGCEHIWDDILSDSGNDTQQYLMWHYISILDKNISEKRLNENYEKDLFKTKRVHMLQPEKQKELFDKLNDLYYSVKLCRNLARGVFPVDGCSPILLNLFKLLVLNLKNDSCIPIYINICKMQRKTTIPGIFENLTFSISKFFFVGKTICGIHANSVGNCYNVISNSIREKTYALQRCNTILIDVLEEKNCMQSFQSAIRGNIYSPNSTAKAKYILLYLELFFHTTNYSTNYLKKRIDDSILIDYERLTTEHIYGQHMSIDNQNVQLEEKLNMLGNLTLLGGKINGDQGNKCFSEKLSVYRKSPYALTRDVSINATWDFAEFSNRQDALIQKAIDIFNIR